MDDLINKLNQINLDIIATKDKTTNIDNKLKAIVEKADVTKTLTDMADSLSRANQGEVDLVKNQLEESICRVTGLQGRLRQHIFKVILVGMEGRPGNLSQTEKFIAALLVNHLGMNSENLGIEQVHRYPKNLGRMMIQYSIYVGFQSWKTANAILRRAKVFTENPLV